MSTPQQDNSPQRAEADAARAAEVLDRGDWRAAISALAAALGIDPFRTDWTALLDRALDAGGAEVEPFLKQPDHAWANFQALRAYVAHRAGDHKTALSELENLTRNFPQSNYAEAWGFGWLTEDAIRAVGPLAMRFLGSAVGTRYPEAEQMNEWGRAQLGRAVAALDRIEAVNGADDFTVLFKGQMLARAGRFEEAVALTEKAAEAGPSFKTATAAAMAHKRAGDVENAVRWFRRASELDPANETSLLDIGDTYAGLAEWRKALEAYEDALARKPDHDWASPSAVYCRYRLTGDPALLEELRDMANAAPDECGMADMMKQMFGGYNFEDRRHRAAFLMTEVEPDFVPTPRPHEHHGEEGEGEEYEDEGAEEGEQGQGEGKQ